MADVNSCDILSTAPTDIDLRVAVNLLGRQSGADDAADAGHDAGHAVKIVDSARVVYLEFTSQKRLHKNECNLSLQHTRVDKKFKW